MCTYTTVHYSTLLPPVHMQCRCVGGYQGNFKVNQIAKEPMYIHVTWIIHMHVHVHVHAYNVQKYSSL